MANKTSLRPGKTNRVRLSGERLKPEDRPVSLREYARYGLWQWIQGVFLILFLIVGCYAPLLGFGVAVVTETALYLVLTRTKGFRHYVHDGVMTSVRAKAANERATLLLQMEDHHRRTLLALESMVDRLQDVLPTPLGTVEQIMLDECAKLLAVFVRVAITYRVVREGLLAVDYSALQERLADLEAHPNNPMAPGQINLIRRRMTEWLSSRDSLDHLQAHLTLIDDAVRLAAQKGHASRFNVNIVGEVMKELDSSHEVLDEMRALQSFEDVDPEILSLGRRSASA